MSYLAIEFEFREHFRQGTSRLVADSLQIFDVFELLQTIERLNTILSSRQNILTVVKDETEAVRGQFGDERRTHIVDDSGDFEIEDLIADEDMVITISNLGYVKRLPIGTYRRQGRASPYDRAVLERLEADDVLILTADHGTNVGDGHYSSFGKGSPPIQNEAHVPLMISLPEGGSGRSRVVK